jgi:hypothetical protein
MVMASSGTPSNKRMEPSGAIVLKEAGRLCPAGHELTFNSGARGARVARGSCASRSMRAIGKGGPGRR